MLRHFTVSTLAPALALVAGMAVAAERPTLESLDTNKDGEVSLNEASANDALFVAFKQLDTNRDGLLSKAEFAAWKG
jgi:Ca2+-binding EF-hand superfamily protein